MCIPLVATLGCFVTVEPAGSVSIDVSPLLAALSMHRIGRLIADAATKRGDIQFVRAPQTDPSTRSSTCKEAWSVRRGRGTRWGGQDDFGECPHRGVRRRDRLLPLLPTLPS